MAWDHWISYDWGSLILLKFSHRFSCGVDVILTAVFIFLWFKKLYWLPKFYFEFNFQFINFFEERRISAETLRRNGILQTCTKVLLSFTTFFFRCWRRKFIDPVNIWIYYADGYCFSLQKKWRAYKLQIPYTWQKILAGLCNILYIFYNHGYNIIPFLQFNE